MNGDDKQRTSSNRRALLPEQGVQQASSLGQVLWTISGIDGEDEALGLGKEGSPAVQQRRNETVESTQIEFGRAHANADARSDTSLARVQLRRGKGAGMVGHDRIHQGFR